MEFADDGRLHRVRMDERLDMEIEDYVPPNGTEVATLTGMAITPKPHGDDRARDPRSGARVGTRPIPRR